MKDCLPLIRKLVGANSAIDRLYKQAVLDCDSARIAAHRHYSRHTNGELDRNQLRILALPPTPASVKRNKELRENYNKLKSFKNRLGTIGYHINNSCEQLSWRRKEKRNITPRMIATAESWLAKWQEFKEKIK